MLDATSPGSSQASTFGCALNPWTAERSVMLAEIFSEPEGKVTREKAAPSPGKKLDNASLPFPLF